MEEGAARGRSVSRLNVLIAITAAIIGLIYGYDLGSIASALLFLFPAFDLSTFMTSAVVLGQLFGRSLLGASPTTAAAGPRRPARKPSERPGSDPPSRPQQVYLSSGTSIWC